LIGWDSRIRIMVFNATFNNISVISWHSFFFVEVSGEHRGNHRPSTCHWQTLSCNVVSSTSPHEWDSIDNFSGDRHWLHSSKSNHHIRVSAGFYYTKVKWPNSYKFLRPFVLKGTYSIGQLCPNLPKTYRSFNDILRCGLIHLMQLELNLIFICFKLAYLLWYFELTTRQVFRGHHLFQKKKLSLSENK
jgi:hypothetical protein